MVRCKAQKEGSDVKEHPKTAHFLVEVVCSNHVILIAASAGASLEVPKDGLGTRMRTEANGKNDRRTRQMAILDHRRTIWCAAASNKKKK